MTVEAAGSDLWSKKFGKIVLWYRISVFARFTVGSLWWLLKFFQAPSDASDVSTFASFWQWSISLSVSSGVLFSKLLFITCVCTVTQTLAFLPSLIEPSHDPDRKLASPAAPAVIQSRLGPGSFSPFWCFRLPLSGYTHAGVSKPVCAWLTPQCKQKMFDFLTSEQGLMSGRRIAVDVQQTGCRVPSCYFPEAKGIFMITSHKHFCSRYAGRLLLCPQLLVMYCKDAHTFLFSVF